MTALNLAPNLWLSIVAAFKFPKKLTKKEAVSQHSLEYGKAEQDLILEMVWNNPEAYSSALDVHYMMDRLSGNS